ncbi:ARM repeat-containing protein [Sparassis crispa]|uniref:ARM repeat-containing protein n=1 Tax=Sparassis crispa TaxID=139825 RepID=A0A401G614_9APHY|nr:ARM repeat-containing protein [Sparassis crispa]GBE77603.1 ARM repeat-containing protein [Sparassis crispa]
MESTTTSSSQSFVPLFDKLPSPSRNLSTASSIWAPQPQPSDTAWSRAIDSFTRVNVINNATRPEARRTTSFPVAFGGEDVFGPVGFVGHRKRDVGAIGDGRKKVSPTSDEIHVEQLLRSLNLNSPAPLIPPSSFPPPSPTSPDLSPISNTSALLTPTDLSPAKMFDPKFAHYDFGGVYSSQPNDRLFETSAPHGYHDGLAGSNLFRNSSSSFPSSRNASAFRAESNAFPVFEPFSEGPSPAPSAAPFLRDSHSIRHRVDSSPVSPAYSQRLRTSSEWVNEERRVVDYTSAILDNDPVLRTVQSSHLQSQGPGPSHAHEPINFLSLLHPSSTPPYHLFVSRIIKSSDQQASIFLQQKLKVADSEERAKIVDAICAKGFEMMAHRFGNWAVQRCLEATASIEERRKIVGCMRGRVVDLATNCYGCHVLQKALDCEEDIRLLIVSELLLGDPAQTLVNKHASHVWSKIMELTWTPPAPPIFTYVNKSLKGKWASLACHETGSLVVQHAFENLEESAKDGIVDELLNQGPDVFGEVAKSQWGSYCVQHILEHGSKSHRDMALDHLLSGLLDYATNEQGVKSVTKALKEGGKETLDKLMKRMCEPSRGGRRAMIVDLALSVTGSQLIASVLPNADKDQRALLYESIRGHIVTLRGCKTGSKVIWLFDRMRAYYGY